MSEKVTVKVERNILHLPAIALRGLVVFPNNLLHFEVGRDKSIAAVEWAVRNKSEVFLIAQKDMKAEDPKAEEMYQYGVVAEIKQVMRVSDDLVRILVEGKFRAKRTELDTDGSFLLASVRPAPVRPIKAEEETEAEALLRNVKTSFDAVLSMNPRISKDVVFAVTSNNDPAFLCEYIPANLLFRFEDKQAVMEESTLIGRLRLLVERLHDILTHDDGDGAAVGDDTGGTQCLQDTNAGAGALDDAGDNGPHQNAQQRIGEADKQAGEPRFVLQGKHSIGHGGHTGHQHSKADQNGANTLALFAFAHVQKDADKSQHRAEGGGLEHIDQEAVALQAGKAQDPAGDRGAHIAAHDNADGLMQLHDAAVDKADHHDRGSAGTLDHSGDAQAKEKAFKGVVSQLAQDLLQLAAGLLFQCFAHDVHAEQEQGKTSKQGKDIEDGHKDFLTFV